MTQIVSIKFNEFGKAYFFDPTNLEISIGDMVIVETAKGLEFGECVRGAHEVEDDLIIKPLRPVVRLATADDKAITAKCKIKEDEALEYCKQKIEDFGLEMKLVNVEFGFEGNKLLFFFTSDGRVDFRELVKDLASKFKVRIELRQIGVRDEAKMLGGLGVCGKQFCCSQFLTEFHPVSIKMAKTQGLSLNPAKISGVCGRLMCCLKYEEVAYKDLIKKAPKIGAFVETPYGKGTVINVNLLRGNVKVRLEDGFDTTLKTCTFEELDVLGGKGRRAEYIVARDEGKLEEAGFKPSPPPPPVDKTPPPLYITETFNSKSRSGQQKNILQINERFERGDKNEYNNRGERSERFNQRDLKSEQKSTRKSRYDNKSDYLDTFDDDDDIFSRHPQPLGGIKGKKTHYKRRKKRVKPDSDS